MRKMLFALHALAIAGLIGTPAMADEIKPLVIINGQQRQLPSGSTLRVNPGTTGAASINVPAGVAPASPSNGDCWNGAKGWTCRINGSSVAMPVTVGTRAALAALHSNFGQAMRTGYTSDGDVPPLSYVASGSACSLNAGAGDNGSQVPTSDGKCWLAAFPSTGFDVRQFGAKGDGTTNDTVAIQRAINFACATSSSPTGYSGGTVFLPRGAYLVSGGLTVPATCPGISIKGDGVGATSGTYLISNETCTVPVIDFYPTATQNYIYGGGVSDVYFFNNRLTGGAFDGTTSCAQPLIRASYGRNMMFNRIQVLSPKIFIKIIGGLNNTVRDIAVDQALQNSTGVFEFMGSGALPDATGQLTRQDLTMVNNIIVFGAPATPGGGNQWYTGIWNHGLSQTININSVKFENASIALKVDCTNPGVSAPLLATNISACPGNSFVYDLETECAGSNCIQMRDTQSWHFQNTYVACFARTSTSNPATSGCNAGIDIANTTYTSTGDISFIGGQVNGAQASCVSNSSFQFTLHSVNLYGCNAANVGGADVTIAAPGANLGGSNSIIGNRMCTGPANNSISETGINIISGSNYNTVSLNNWKGCGAGIIGTPGANSVVVNNVGP